MSTVKTRVTIGEVRTFLREEYAEPIRALHPLRGGEYSRAFAFDTSEGKYVIRANNTARTFRKDVYAYRHFRSDAVPIPKIIKIGRLNERLFFSISERVAGKVVEDFNTKDLNELLPQLMRTLDAIHSTKISSQGKRSGDLNMRGVGMSDSWRSYILSIQNKTGQEKEFFEEVEEKIRTLVRYCPEKRSLVHGDYGFNNVLADGKKITGVIDWGEMKYGDFLFDIAWLDFWSRDVQYAEKFKVHYKKVGIAVENYEERIACYQLFLGLSSFVFFVNSGQKKAARWVKKHTESILSSTIKNKNASRHAHGYRTVTSILG
ncbi:MAG: aminoglycoside phosphotransferase family protein [Candidatus Spechtbacterales bacterium]